MKILINGILLGLCFVNGQVLAASFDCAKASTDVEKMICGSKELSQLDEELTQNYLEARRYSKSNNDKDQLRSGQKKWLYIRDSCSDVECIKAVYIKRNADLNLWNERKISDSLRELQTQERAKSLGIHLNKKKVSKFPSKVGWDYSFGYGDFLGADDDMCQKLKEYMNINALSWHSKSASPSFMENSCVSSGRLFSDFYEPPWEDLEPNKYMGLIANIFRYQEEGARKYFGILKGNNKKTDEYYQAMAMAFISKGGRLQYWRARALGFSTDINNLTLRKLPLSDQNIIQLRYQILHDEDPSDDKCRQANWRGSVFIVNDRLDDLDANINELDFPSGTLFLFKEKMILYRDSSSDIEISRNDGDGVFTSVCSLSYPYYNFKRGE